MKFKLVENRLHEAISPSIPSWLKPLIINSFIKNNRYQKSKFSEIGSDYGRSTPYSYASRNKYKDYDLNSKLANGFAFSGNNLSTRYLNSVLFYSSIDFANAEFIHSDTLPKNSKDEFFNSDKYVCFFLVEKDGAKQIWVPGYNDKEPSIVDNINGYGKTYKYLSYNKIKPYITDFYYVDLTKPESHKKVRNRDQIDPILSRRYKRGNVPNPSGYWNGPPLDKSGYIRNPEKYKKVLERNRAKNYDSLLQKLHDDLVETKEQISSAYTNADLNYDSIRILESASYDLRQAISCYDDILQSIDIYNESIADKEEKEKALISLFDKNSNSSYNYKNALKSSVSAQNKISGLVSSVLDW